MFLHYGIEEGPATGPVHSPVAAVLGPCRNDLPIPLEDIVAAGPSKAGIIDSRNDEELSEVVGPGIVDDLLIGEFVAAEPFCDAGFEGAFDRVARKIVRSAELSRAR